MALAKPDPYDLYEKSRAIFESRRKYQRSKRGWISGVHGLRDRTGKHADDVRTAAMVKPPDAQDVPAVGTRSKFAASCVQ